MRKASKIDMGMVITQVINILPTIPQLIDLGLSAVPVPMMNDVITCVVDNGMPKAEAVCNTNVDVISDVNPFIGSILIILRPMVLMMRHPPTEVPKAIASAA